MIRDFFEYINMKREAKKLSFRQIGRGSNMSKAWIQKILSGGDLPEPKDFIPLLMGLEVSEDEKIYALDLYTKAITEKHPGWADFLNLVRRKYLEESKDIANDAFDNELKNNDQ